MHREHRCCGTRPTVTCLTAVAGVGVAQAAPKRPSSPPVYKALTYVVWGGSAGYDLYTMAADGSGQTMLPKSSSNADTTTTNSPATEWSPVYSPGGGLIAYQSSRGGDPDVWVQNTSTGAMTRVTSSAEAEAPVGWYVAGGEQRLVYGTNDRLFSVKPDGTDAFAVTTSTPGMQRRSVSSSGEVAVAADRGDGTVRIYTFAIDRTSPAAPSTWTQASAPPAGVNDAGAAWTPDGGLLFARGNALKRLPPGTSESPSTPATTVLTQAARVGNPSYSPATGQLAYDVNSSATGALGWEIAVTTVGADWTAAPGRVLTRNPSGQTSQPTWKN